MVWHGEEQTVQVDFLDIVCKHLTDKCLPSVGTFLFQLLVLVVYIYTNETCTVIGPLHNHVIYFII